MPSLWFTFLFGLFLGLKHALEADHLTAVVTLVSKHKNSFRAALVGTFWGIGHTTTLFVIGLLVLLLKISIPPKLELSLELLVGVMLVFLGIRAIWKRDSIHEHTHAHVGETHTHLHVDHDHQHKQSFTIGAVHGLAGSGALMVLVLATIQSVVEGVIYILLFGIGSIIGMTIMSFLVGLPFSLAHKKLTEFNKVQMYIQIIAGIVSIGLGFWIIYEISVVDHLIL